MNKTNLILITILATLFCSAQKQGNVWYFGDQVGLDFNSGAPVFISGGQNTIFDCPSCHSEAASSICDSSGALLFYSNAAKIWNRNHQVILNGDSLKSNPSSTQGALFVPKPGSDRYFYLFTTDAFYKNNLKYGFRYSLIDICMDNGLGGVVENQKNIKLLDTVAEKLAAVKHSNGVDYWIVVHKYYSDAFYAYQLTPSGINSPVISHIGSFHPTGTQNVSGSFGQMKISPNGQKIAVVNGNASVSLAEYFDFNTATGVVSNSVNLQWNANYGHYGVAFSPDNSKLYVACALNGNGIFQFDLSAGGGSSVAVNASRTQIAFTYNYLGIQLGPDGKIYCARSPIVGNTYLSVIGNPNNAGLACNYADSVVSLNSKAASYGPPNFIAGYNYSNTKPSCSTTDIGGYSSEEHYAVFPNPANGLFKILISKPIQNGQLQIINSTGQCVFSQNVVEGINEFSIKDLPAGVYHYILLQNRQMLKTGRLTLN